MADDVAKLVEAVDQIALQMVILEPDNLMALGSLLRELETIEKINLEPDLKPVGALSEALRKLVEKAIVNELKDVQKGFDLMGRGIELIQKCLSNRGQPRSDDDGESFWKEMESLEGIAKPEGLGPVPEAGPPSKPTFDVT